MPFLDSNDEQMSLPDVRGSIPHPDEVTPQPGLWGAAFREANIGGSLYNEFQHPQPTGPATPGFDPEASVPKGYEPVADIFAGARNAEDIEWRRQQFDREQQDAKIIQSHGGYGVAAAMLAGTVDPLTIASMAVPVGGEARLARMGQVALAAGATSAAQEAVMRNLQVSRTDKDSTLNVGASMVIGGLLGGIHVPRIGAMADRLHEELHGEGGETVLGPMDGRSRIVPESDVTVAPPHPESGKVEAPTYSAEGGTATSPAIAGADDAKPKMPEAGLPEVGGELHVNPEAESTSGAAAVSTPTIRGESIARGVEAYGNFGIKDVTPGRVSPGWRLMNSPSIESRKLIQELANLPETLTKNYEGIATASPIERELWKYDGVNWQGQQARDLQWRAYRERIAGEGGAPIERGAFNEGIAQAMRRGDTHAIPEIAQAAKDTRRIVFDPLKERAQAAGALPEEAQAVGADSYLTRQYDGAKIRANQTDWINRLRQGFMKQGMESAEALDVAHKATRNILGSERGTMDWHALDDIVPKSGRLKERTLTLPDTLLEPYLNSDIDHLSHSYLRSLAPEVEMTERFGSRDMKDQMQGVFDDYARMIQRAKSDGEKKALQAAMDHDVRDLSAVRDRLYGIYGQPKDPGSFMVRAGRMLRTVNALRLLGAATLAHFPDLANVMMRFGMGKTFGAIGKMLTSPGAFTLGKNEAKRMGAALDMSMNATASLLGDYANHSQYLEQRVGNYLSRKFTILTGETPLITAAQSLTSTLAGDTIVRAGQKLANGGEIGANQMARYAAAGLNEDMLKRIAAEHEAHGVKINGLNFGMSDKWTDQVAARKFESAVLRDAHSVTLRPGVGDTPLFMSTEWGKTLRQFTTFGYAAQRSVVNPLMQGLAHGDPRAAQALLSLAAMGTLSYVAKQTAAGQPIEPFDSPRFGLEVLDKSNLMGWTGDYVFPALWMGGLKSLSRWSDRDPVETIGGPSAGMVADLYSRQLPAKFLASSGVYDDQKGVSRADLHFMRRMAPGQNLWYFRNSINALEDAVGDTFDLPGKSNADRAEETMQ